MAASSALELTLSVEKTQLRNHQPLFEGTIKLCDNVANKVFLPYVGDCTKYYLCWYGTAIERKCERNYQFDSKLQRCVRPGKGNCLPECEFTKFSSFAYDRTCTKYVLCYYGIPVLRECHEDLQFNAATERCDYPQFLDCVDNECSVFNNANDLRLIPSKTSCSKYFLCDRAQPKNMTCSEGLHFGKECSCCQTPEEAECKLPALKRHIEAYSNSPLRRADIICPSDGVHFYAHKTRKDAYYFCADGHGITLDCTPGLKYDPRAQECRNPKYMQF
ncbi:CG10140, partial [Drosophila busckii]